MKLKKTYLIIIIITLILTLSCNFSANLPIELTAAPKVSTIEMEVPIPSSETSTTEVEILITEPYIANDDFLYFEDFVYYITDNTVWIIGYKGSGKDIIIPSFIENRRVTKIRRDAFYNTDITSVTIPNGVTSIGEYAFGSCFDLTSIDIPNSVTSIEHNLTDKTTTGRVWRTARKICPYATGVPL